MPRRLFWPFLKFLLLAKAASPGTRWESGREHFPPLQGAGSAQTRACPGQGSAQGAASGTQEMAEEASQTAQSLPHPGRPHSSGVDFRHSLGSMLKALGSIPEHFFFFFSPQIMVMKQYTFILLQTRGQTLGQGC